MRHGESQNNIVQAKGNANGEAGSFYENNRTYEPEISETGVKSCQAMGQQLNTLGFTFSKIFCSAQKRAILSAKHLRNGFSQEIPIEIILHAHENKGVYQGSEVKAGLTRS